MSKKLTLAISNLTLTIEESDAGNPLARAIFGALRIVPEENGKDEGAQPDAEASAADAGQAAGASTEATTESTEAAPVTTDDILAFLGGSERYNARTFGAIQKAFPDASAEHLSDLLEELVGNEEVDTKRRRRDGATLYSVA